MLLHSNRTQYRKRMDGETSMEKELQKKNRVQNASICQECQELHRVPWRSQIEKDQIRPRSSVREVLSGVTSPVGSAVCSRNAEGEEGQCGAAGSHCIPHSSDSTRPHRTSHHSKSHLTTYAATSYHSHQRPAFSKHEPHPQTKKQYLKKTDVMKERHQTISEWSSEKS